ncbi:19714_t:CDS:2 [Funneliformis geosporum]|uniref:19714_t:CDS:1 n=1 Tax=Funneliformis geosporum TaxID=1117311 RepID=A0A9W4WMX8_9GLOM|nr:19714_t:CDS:2 [Funneliformis geosporum]
MSIFLTSLSRDFSNILGDSDEYNVLIKVGSDENNEETFQAHSLVLKARFMYTGIIEMEQQKGKDLLKLLVAADELLLNELHETIQDYFLIHKTDWIQQNFALVHKTVFQLELSKELQEFCLIIICEEPQLIFKSKDFTNLEEETLISLLGRSDMNMEEVVIWDHVLEWGIAQNPELTIDISKWKNEDFALLKETLENLIPYIRFFIMNSAEFYNKVRPFKKILPKDLYEDLKRFHLKTGLQLKSEYLQTQRYVGVKSTIIDQNHAAMLCSWIDGVGFNIYYKKNLSAKISRVSNNCSAYAISDSQSKGPCFGDGDLWMKDQFNQAGSCYCNKESYEQSVGDMFHRDSWEGWTGKNGTFAVDDYEVFQVIRKRIINN